MKKIIGITILVSLTFLMGFSGCNKPVAVDPCAKSPKMWTGRAGSTPADNDVWKCHNWILKSQDLER